jgi:hypothetical protein
MNSKYKFLCVILACVLILPLFSSCAGIGDGALFDNITTGEPKEITLEPEDGIVCKLVAYYAEGKEIMDEAAVEGVEAENIYAYLNDSSEYTNAVDEVAMSHPYIHVTFEGIEELKIDLDSNNAVGGIEEYYVYSSDNVDITNVNLDSGRTGHLEGSYEKLFKYIEKHGAAMGHFCKISTSDAPQAFTKASSEKVLDMYLMLSQNELPSGSVILRTDEEKAYVLLSFWGAADADYYVYSDDYVEEYNTAAYTNATLIKELGFIDGAYEKAIELLEYSMNTVTEEEKAAGVKLNCLRVKMIPGISRTFFLSEFESIGAFYMEERVDSTGHYAIVYFASCTPEELEDKRAEVKKNSVVDTVQTVFVIESGILSVN